MAYDAFLSYSHAADGKLAPQLQAALQRFAKPWWKLRALNVFRDETSLAAASSLGGAILAALDGARFFVFLASPAASRSKWCRAELAHWLANRAPDTLLIVLTEGSIAWNDAAGDFDWERTDALPRELKGVFKGEPFHLDLAWAKSAAQLDGRESRFQSVVAKLAATLHGKSLEAIAGEEVRQHRRTRRVAAVAVASIGLLAIGATAAAYRALLAERAAIEQAARAERERFAAERSLEQALSAADALVVEVADRLQDVEGVPIELVKSVLEKAERIFATLDVPDAPDAVRARRAAMLGVFSEAYLAIGNTAEALARAEAMRTLLEGMAAKDLVNLQLRGALADAHQRVGHALWARGSEKDAVKEYQTAIELAGLLLRLRPGDREWRALEGVVIVSTADRVSDPFMESSAVIAGFRRARDIFLELTRAEPDNRAWLRFLAAAYEGEGRALSYGWERNYVLDFGLEVHREALKLRERLAELEPGRYRAQRDLAAVLAALGDLFQRRKETAEALNAHRKALAIRERLARLDLRNTAMQAEWARSNYKAGDALLAAGDHVAAAGAFEAALKIQLRLLEIDSDNVDWQEDFIRTRNAIANTLVQKGDRAAAIEHYKATLKLVEAWEKRQPGSSRLSWTSYVLEQRIHYETSQLRKEAERDGTSQPRSKTGQ